MARYDYRLQTELGDLVVQFDATSSFDHEGPIVEYLWDFNDSHKKTPYSDSGWLRGFLNKLGWDKISVADVYGHKSVEAYTYSEPGTYNVKLAVRDRFGQWTQTEKRIEVIDRTPPVLSISSPQENETIYVKSFPTSVLVKGSANEILTAASSYEVPLSLSSQQVFSGSVKISEEGAQDILISGADRWGNKGTTQIRINLVYDVSPPVVMVGSYPALTNKSSISIPVSVTEENPGTTTVKANGKVVLSTVEKAFAVSVPLDKEGANSVEISSVDGAKNISTPMVFSVIRDTTPPVLSFVNPMNGDGTEGVSFSVKVASNEALHGTAKINDKSIAVKEGATDFEAVYTSSTGGVISLVAQAEDLAGNQAQQTIQVTSLLKALNSSLVGLYPDVKSNKMIIKGAVGSTRPFSEVYVSGGLFNSDSVQSDKRGSFTVALEPESEYKVRVNESSMKNQIRSASFTYGIDQEVILAGTVREQNDKPLVNVTVTIAGTKMVTKSDANGVFKFTRSSSEAIATGDQQLLVDGSTAIIPDDGVPRKYSKTSLSITIGERQNNILPTPVHLIPTYLDETSVEIVAASGGRVSSSHAPGAALDIPAGATQFPDGSSKDKISLMEVSAEYTTLEVPSVAVPKKVIALEPAGTIFSKSVQLTLPNVNDFPPGTEMVIMLMNPKTGQWEIGGAAKVSSTGQDVVTKDNQGIRQFSFVYATIMGPTIRQIGAQDRPGADTFNGAVSTKVEMPSFMELCQRVVPNLIYKSTWAKPSVVVTNLFDFPSRTIDLKPVVKFYGSDIVGYTRKLVVCEQEKVLSTSSKCYNNPKEFYTNLEYEGTLEKIRIQPQRIIANLKTDGLKTEEHEFQNIPPMASVSFAVDLKNSKNDTGYFKSGMYPYRAEYSIYFKELVLGTITRRDSQGQVATENLSKEGDGERSLSEDLIESIYVQNYRNSIAGRGWKIGGVQRIINPTGNKLVLEEADGGISTYSLKNTIETVFDVESQLGDVRSGVALNAWPTIAMAGGANEILASTFDGLKTSRRVIGTNYSLDGKMAGYDFYNYYKQNCREEEFCAERWQFPGGNMCIRSGKRDVCDNVLVSYCATSKRDYSLNATPSQMLYLNGRIIGVDSQEMQFLI